MSLWDSTGRIVSNRCSKLNNKICCWCVFWSGASIGRAVFADVCRTLHQPNLLPTSPDFFICSSHNYYDRYQLLSVYLYVVFWATCTNDVISLGRTVSLCYKVYSLCAVKQTSSFPAVSDSVGHIFFLVISLCLYKYRNVSRWNLLMI